MTKKFTDEQIKEFWQHHDRFLKTNLMTEAANPLTANLSELCNYNLPESFQLFQKVELLSIRALFAYTDQIYKLQKDIQQTLTDGHKIYLVGCGASGRLAMLMKRLYELSYPNKPKQIICVSSAGDTSLIKSVEQFEDNRDFGVKQLLQQGYTDNDLVVGLTASGESPFILSSVEFATNKLRTPWLIFNNPINSLLERNPNHLVLNKQVNGMQLEVGSMALTGSTRLQATTAMQIALGIALCGDENIKSQINQIYNLIEAVPLVTLSAITTKEAEILSKNEFILYQTDNALIGLSLLADITERSPTFNLIPFENTTDPKPLHPSIFYLKLANTNAVDEAWDLIFGQAPTCLNWPEFSRTSTNYMTGFDLSENSERSIGKYLLHRQHTAIWQPTGNSLKIHLENIELNYTLPDNLFHRTLIYKLLLNSHSTLMMGRLNFFDGNMMLSLKPSNFKLIDRAIRYSQFILKQKHNIDIDYKELAKIVFAEIEKLQPNQSIVENVIGVVQKRNA